MKRRFQVTCVLMLLIILFSLGMEACRRAEEEPFPEQQLEQQGLTEIAHAIATVYFPHGLLRVRLRRVPPGWFALGADPEEDNLLRDDETPQTDTHEPGFWMGEGEVTNEEYALCMESGVCSSPSIRKTGPTNHFGDPAYDDHPVVGVNWFQAQGYCEWIESRLPSEAEWEKAARGATAIIYPWGNDIPTCDRANANLPGCTGGGETMPSGSYPLGASPYGFLDMAGNVREWVYDWYDANVYLTAAAYMPTGPAEGEKKVVRGGGFNDFEENLRTTARLAFDPAQDFDDVGFRCVPVTPSYAPMCEPSYVPLCYDPDIPRNDDPCEPGQNLPGEEGITLLGFGCPMNKTVCFQVSTNGGGTSGYNATVDTSGFTCSALDERPDILECCGPEQPMGRNVEITICAPGGSPTGAVASTTSLAPAAGITLASFGIPGMISLMQSSASNCPDGYTYDQETGECILDKKRTDCPDNWTFDRQAGACVPNDPQEDCPPTTTFSANLGGCQPEDGVCPDGYYLTNQRVCEPDQNRSGDCPPGYYFNAKINCCEPIPADNYDCPDGYYWHEKYEKCIPLDDNNCAYGTTYNGYGLCDQDPFAPGPNDAPQGDCPPGLFLAAANICDPQEDYFTPDNPVPGTALRPGDTIGPDGMITPEQGLTQPDCPEGYYYHEKYQRCIERDSDGCPAGYYFDARQQQCVPTNGPNSPCPIGFVYDRKTECCVPQPGFDSTNCPDDQTTPVGTVDPTQMMTPFAAANFDPNSGECEDDGRHDDGIPCPAGTFAANMGQCDQLPEETGQPDQTQSPEALLMQSAECPPNYWNTETQTCDYPQPDCGVNEYYNPRLGYCVPLQDDCCEIGQDYAAFYKECVDVATKPRDGECPQGFELVDGVCWLIGRTEGQGGMCWTITRNTPQCVGPCEVGFLYNAKTGRCEKPAEQAQPTDPCANINCPTSNCPSNCCHRDKSGACVAN